MATIKTRILILSDTHGSSIPCADYGHLDLVIHCGDLTEGSKLSEFKTTLETLKQIPASTKLIIAGNHDFTLHDEAYRQILKESRLSLDDPKVKEEYGDYGEALDLLRSSGLRYLDEGSHNITLQNGAFLKIYASPYTPFKADQDSGMGFQYHPHSGHEWDIPPDVDVVMTHGPPKGIFDYTASKQRAGDPDLFSAIARASPLLHCFGHIHPGWGARKVLWREDIEEEAPSHFTAIDNSGSQTIESATGIRQREDDKIWKSYRKKGYYVVGLDIARDRRETLFINAAVQGPDEESAQVPWMVEIELPTRSVE